LGSRAMENAWDALRKGSASEVLGKTRVGRLLFLQTPGSDPALAGMRVLDLAVELEGSAPAPSFRGSADRREDPRVSRQVLRPSATWHGHPGHAKVGTCKSFLPSPSTGWEARATRHVLAVFQIGARCRAGGAEAGRSLPFSTIRKSYERTRQLIENKREGFRNPSTC
jgi:hypothetical protein